jgi:hypothetical protein
MLDLSSSVILAAVGSTKIQETIKAIDYCHKFTKFFQTVYLTDANISEYKNITHIKTRNIPSIVDYQSFVVKEIPNIILSNNNLSSFNGHFLFINWDGFIVNTNSWNDQFLEYDYIGAPWPWFNYKVGNGGFCLKSKRFLICQKELCNNYTVKHNEDVELAIVLRKQFEFMGCKYADTKIGYNFSTEYGGYDNFKSFGFHDFKYNPQFLKLLSTI